jgi:hypothetical protein
MTANLHCATFHGDDDGDGGGVDGAARRGA